jgi:hypothetical protein
VRRCDCTDRPRSSASGLYGRFLRKPAQVGLLLPEHSITFGRRHRKHAVPLCNVVDFVVVQSIHSQQTSTEVTKPRVSPSMMHLCQRAPSRIILECSERPSLQRTRKLVVHGVIGVKVHRARRLHRSEVAVAPDCCLRPAGVDFGGSVAVRTVRLYGKCERSVSHSSYLI